MISKLLTDEQLALNEASTSPPPRLREHGGRRGGLDVKARRSTETPVLRT